MSNEVRSFRDLVAWQKGIELCKCVYATSARFPDAERFGLTAQMRRAAISVPSNIAEGYGRRRTGDYVRFLDIARGSLYEVQTQLVLADELGMASSENIKPGVELADEVARVLFGLVRSVTRSE